MLKMRSRLNSDHKFGGGGVLRGVFKVTKVG